MIYAILHIVFFLGLGWVGGVIGLLVKLAFQPVRFFTSHGMFAITRIDEKQFRLDFFLDEQNRNAVYYGTWKSEKAARRAARAYVTHQTQLTLKDEK